MGTLLEHGAGLDDPRGVLGENARALEATSEGTREAADVPSRTDDTTRHTTGAEQETWTTGAQDGQDSSVPLLDRAWIRVLLVLTTLVGVGLAVAGATLLLRADTTSGQAEALAAERTQVEAEAEAILAQVTEQEGLTAETTAATRALRTAADDVVDAADALLVAIEDGTQAQNDAMDAEVSATEAWNRGDESSARSIIRQEVFPAVERLRAANQESAAALRDLRAAIEGLEEALS